MKSREYKEYKKINKNILNKKFLHQEGSGQKSLYEAMSTNPPYAIVFNVTKGILCDITIPQRGLSL